MIELNNSSAQTIAPGAAVTFNTVLFKSGSCECWNRMIPTVVKLLSRGGIYQLDFSGNIASATANTPVQLALAIEGAAMPETVMVSTPTAANAFNSVSTQTKLRNACSDLSRVSVINTGTVPVILSANFNLSIKRIG